MGLQREIQSFSTIINGSQPHGSIAVAIKIPWRVRSKTHIIIDVSEINSQSRARLLKSSAQKYDDRMDEFLEHQQTPTDHS